MFRVVADRLIHLCARDAAKIAEDWYKALCSNPRTQSYHLMSKEGCLQHATFILKSLEEVYFAKDCNKAVADFLDKNEYVERHFARGIPLHEMLYALVLLRRHLWLHAESELIFYSPEDMVYALESINRVILVFDYAMFNVVRKYQELERKTGKVPV